MKLKTMTECIIHKRTHSINKKDYKNLYIVDIRTEEAEEAREECIKSVPRLVTTEQNRDLERAFDTIELHQATKDLPNNKAPCPDRMPIEFFKALWNKIGEDITEYTNSAFISGYLEDKVNNSNMTLLLKDGSRYNIKNWRSIFLLNSLYKVVAKGLANRVQPHLHSWIRPHR